MFILILKIKSCFGLFFIRVATERKSIMNFRIIVDRGTESAIGQRFLKWVP